MPLIIGIAGGTGSGKTTIAKTLRTKIGIEKTALICEDAYYLDRSHMHPELRQKINYDHPDAFDHKLLEEHLKSLLKGLSVEIPLYDFCTHTRKPERVFIPPRPVILIEGILVLAEERLRTLMDLKIFVDTEADIRLLRRLQRDVTKRGRNLESVIKQYLTTVKPMHKKFIEPSKSYADFLINEDNDNDYVLDLITSHINSILAVDLSL